MLPVGALRLPEIRSPPSPSEQHKQIICEMDMDESTDEARLPRFFGAAPRSSASTVGYTERTRSRPRGASLDDFLGEPSLRPARSSRQARAARPTHRQAIDDETAVPAEVFESMLRAGQEARGRANHTLSFSQTDGRPYLRHHNADALESGLCPMVVDEPELPVSKSPSPVPLLPRPPSSCAFEMAGQHWAHEAVALQVG